MTPANRRTLGRVLIGLALLVVAIQVCGMLHLIPKLPLPLAYPAFLFAIVGGRLYRRGAAQGS